MRQFKVALMVGNDASGDWWVRCGGGVLAWRWGCCGGERGGYGGAAEVLLSGLFWGLFGDG